MQQVKIRLAIIGAGMGGLTLSSALRKMGADQSFEINIYEASSQISEIGAGINFWPRGWNIMKALGLEQSLLELLPRAPDDSFRTIFQVRKSDQHEGVHIRDLTMKGGSVRFHRADLQSVLLRHSSGHVHLSHRLVSFEEVGDEVRLHFEDGKTVTCDFLVGMDGIKSAVRRNFLLNRGLSDSPSINPVCSGDIAYRGLVPTEILEKDFPEHRALTTPMLYFGKLKLIITYPIAQNKLVNIAAINTDLSKEGDSYDGPTTVPCSKDEVQSIFAGWEEEVQSLFRCIERPTKWTMRILKPMDRYSSGRVVLGGDAAHAMTPFLGSGAGRAVEDAYILSSLMSQGAPSKDELNRISDIYNAVCCPEGNQLIESSRQAGRVCQLVSPAFEGAPEGDINVPLEKLENHFQQFNEFLECVWKVTAEDDRSRALEMLHELGGAS